ncbi:hypothetical protein HK405_014579, partial [Cladochytrium tenue]
STLIAIPEDLLITIHTVDVSLGGALSQLAHLTEHAAADHPTQAATLPSEHAALALFLALHRPWAAAVPPPLPPGLPALADRWRPYVATLPRSFDTVAGNLPDGLLALLPPAVRTAAARQRAKIARDLVVCARAVGVSEDDLHDDFSWAWYAVIDGD